MGETARRQSRGTPAHGIKNAPIKESTRQFRTVGGWVGGAAKCKGMAECKKGMLKRSLPAQAAAAGRAAAIAPSGGGHGHAGGRCCS